MTSPHAEALASARAEVVRLQGLAAAAECAERGHGWCMGGEEGPDHYSYICFRCGAEKIVEVDDNEMER